MRTTIKLIAMTMVLALGTAQAGVTITVEQDGSNVVATGGGTLNTTDLTPQGLFGSISAISGTPGYIGMGPTNVPNVEGYSAITGPLTMGSGPLTQASTGTGNNFDLNAESSFLFVPTSYVSGTSLTASATYTKQTIASLGLNPGTYTWTWGTGINADSFTVQIGGVPAVPEPSAAVLAVFGAAFTAYGWSRHRRATRRQAAA